MRFTSLISGHAFAGHILGLCSVIGVSGKIEPMEQGAPLPVSGRGWPGKIAHWDTDYSDCVYEERKVIVQ